MKNAAPAGTGAALSSSENKIGDPRQIAANIPDQSRASQGPHPQSGADSAIHCGTIWKSPRDKRQCIEGKIKSYQGSPPFFDIRILELDAGGRMVPTSKGITCSMARLPQLAQLIGTAVRKASAAGLLTQVST
jgi:hypothetical protein